MDEIEYFKLALHPGPTTMEKAVNESGSSIESFIEQLDVGPRIAFLKDMAGIIVEHTTTIEQCLGDNATDEERVAVENLAVEIVKSVGEIAFRINEFK